MVFPVMYNLIIVVCRFAAMGRALSRDQGSLLSWYLAFPHVASQFSLIPSLVNCCRWIMVSTRKQGV